MNIIAQKYYWAKPRGPGAITASPFPGIGKRKMASLLERCIRERAAKRTIDPK